MRYECRAKVEASCELQGDLRFEWRDFDFTFTVDDSSRPIEVAVQFAVIDYLKYLPALNRHGDSHRLAMRELPRQREVQDLLHYMESVGSFWFQVRKIHWDSLENIWIPESEKERAETSVLRMRTTESYPEDLNPIPAVAMRDLLEMKPELEHLTIPLSFYREGVIYFRSFRYVVAFTQFYLFLEGLFGGGKSRNRQVEENFLASELVQEAVAEGQRAIQVKQHWESIREFLRAENCEESTEGLTRLLVRARGTLSHYWISSSKKKGHPLNQREYQSLAYWAFTVCKLVIARVIIGGPLR